jgi:hypothetical protein
MSATTEVPVGRLPEVWRLKVAGVTFTATAEVRRNHKGFASVLVTILTDTPLVYVPSAVQNQFCDDVAARVGRLPTALEFVDGREELTVSANPRGGR